MGKAKVILVVEDNPDNSMLVKKVLTYYKFEVVIKENGEEALEWCTQNVPDLILMDISLPGKDGLEITSILRKQPAFAHTPIVALTAHAMVGWREKTKEAGCTDYITKPFRPKELVAIIEKHIHSS